MSGKDILGFKSFANKFGTSFVAGVEAGVATAQSPSFQRLVRKYARDFLKMFAVVYAFAMLLWLPIAAIVGLIDGIGGLDMGSRIPGAFALFCKISETMGPVLLLILNWRSFGISEQFFFEQLSEIAPDLSRKLQSIPTLPVHQLLWDGLKRYCQYAMVGISIFLISLLSGGPLIRSLAEAGLNFYIMSRVFGYHVVGGAAAGLRLIPDEVWAATGLPISSWHVTQAVKVFVLARSVFREVLDPYVSRARHVLRQEARAPDQRKRHVAEVDGIILCTVMRRDIPSFLGFAFPYALLMSLPIVGPLVILFAQAAAAHLVRPMLTDASRRYQ